jgi:hypothetical protein
MFVSVSTCQLGQIVEIGNMSAEMTRLNIDVATDLATKISKAAATAGITVDAMINECLAQQFETALRHRVLVQRQGDVDEALLELARLVGRLSAGGEQQRRDICRYRSADTT